jgi:3-phosphoshikimate 1-carboxyvinyltransferase
MSVRIVRPGTAVGTVRAPGSKSYTHRALVAGHLSGHRYEVGHPLDSDDTRATARAIDALGTHPRLGGPRWTLLPRRTDASRAGSIDCGESGTTLRFAAALAARGNRPIRLRGRGRLPVRPMEDLFGALECLGASCDRPPGGHSLPVTIRGPLHGGSIRLDASRSSQFASSLLLTLPTLPDDSHIRLMGAIVSEPYLDATLAVLRYHGVRVDRNGRDLTVPGGQEYRRRGMRVPGDASSACYLWAAGALTGGRVRVRGIPADWPQADRAILGLLREAGSSVAETADGVTVEGRPDRAFSMDFTSCPDLYPLAGVIAATIDAPSTLRGADQVVLKESDRRAATIRLARTMGADVRPTRRGLVIRGRARPRRLRLAGLSDHRVVMSAAVGALVADKPSSIGDADAVTKSFPAFWNVLDSLREGGRA